MPDHLTNEKKKYITADVARFGSDLAVIGVWEDWELIEVHEFEISKTTEIQNCIKALQKKHSIPKDQCIADADGVGGFLKGINMNDVLKGAAAILILSGALYIAAKSFQLLATK